MKRNIYDKSCFQAVNGKMGRLQTVFQLPVLANDTVSLNFFGSFRLAKLRRWLSIDCMVHVALYFVKHRWCYDGSGSTEEWQSFIKNSLSSEHASNSTLETIDVTVAPSYHADCFGIPDDAAGSVPAHYVKGYNKIWNRWYRVPNITDEVAEDYVSANFNDLRYGYNTARLPAFWNTGVDTDRLDADPELIADPSAQATPFTLVDIAQIQAEYQDDLDRDWFARRYKDLMESKWGSNGITNEVDDNQAELLMDANVWCSGVDIHGTDQNSLGTYIGKGVTNISIQMPPRYFNEHGMIWCVCTPRFPAICEEESHYTLLNTLTADNFLAYPEVVRSQPPVEILENDVFQHGSDDSYGKTPFGNWFRFNNNRVTRDYATYTGFPFLRSGDITTASTFAGLTYHDDNDLVSDGQNRFFATTSELQHWNMISKAEIEVRSVLPKASESIFAGATHIN